MNSLKRFIMWLFGTPCTADVQRVPESVPANNRCPYCENDMELILPCMQYDDPIVYKCNHCRCTITLPGTISDGTYYTRREPILSMHMGDVIRLSGKNHSSVGIFYKLFYDEDAFIVNKEIIYHNPEDMAEGLEGADAASVVYTLKPCLSGLFCISEATYFRDKRENLCIHYYFVE